MGVQLELSEAPACDQRQNMGFHAAYKLRRIFKTSAAPYTGKFYDLPFCNSVE